ncbi:aminotransferase class V-fold PLP-dependent enzyme [Allorhizobium sp. BGMRC 0089]|uniref:pyridoxal phosphate-dependent decarboxylase family protein n=1 Tax=Allorhizobium sonneratiae TaxID=2934936 RepID=UPI0020341FFD|nr:aminotransferase class V-fold PLP-dependent enzyme [Allorhizobium sonneratiae]MCM2293078.1 aminotransferase class V-fold PLP-dependent enzyme [Allorhizobium sonneratiae]
MTRSLDPEDWQAFRQTAHALLDEVIDHIATIRDRPVWRQADAAAKAHFTRPLPVSENPLEAVVDDVKTHVMPFATGNLHPLFMGWVHGAGTPTGMVAEIVSAGLNMNCGGRNHIGLDVERQIALWMSEALGFPKTASGVFVTGSSMANFMAVVIARTRCLGPSVRVDGVVGQARQLIAYTSSEAHGCIAQAMELSGLGSAQLRKIPVDDAGRIRTDRLKAAIAADRAEGHLPFLLVGTAGTVNTGAIDPLGRLAAIATEESLWFHVDGAIGAMMGFSPALRGLLEGVEQADSIAMDFHKWGQVPYDAGFLLVKDPEAHRAAFAQPMAYLQRAERGLAAGEIWPCDLGPDLSRGARALKTWMTIETLGSARIGAAIERSCHLARSLAERLGADPRLEIKAPVALNIVCFGIRGADRDMIRTIVMDLHEKGIAAPSWTTLNGEEVIRCALVNHRTSKADLERFIAALQALMEHYAL